MFGKVFITLGLIWDLVFMVVYSNSPGWFLFFFAMAVFQAVMLGLVIAADN